MNIVLVSNKKNKSFLSNAIKNTPDMVLLGVVQTVKKGFADFITDNYNPHILFFDGSTPRAKNINIIESVISLRQKNAKVRIIYYYGAVEDKQQFQDAFEMLIENEITEICIGNKTAEQISEHIIVPITPDVCIQQYNEIERLQDDKKDEEPIIIRKKKHFKLKRAHVASFVSIISFLVAVPLLYYVNKNNKGIIPVNNTKAISSEDDSNSIDSEYEGIVTTTDDSSSSHPSETKITDTSKAPEGTTVTPTVTQAPASGTTTPKVTQVPQQTYAPSGRTTTTTPKNTSTPTNTTYPPIPIKINTLSLSSSFLNNNIVLNISQTTHITPVILPVSATNKKLTWSSNRPQIAVVDSNGNVTARSMGKAIITAYTTDGSSLDASVMVTVK